MDVWDYFHSRETECLAASLYPQAATFGEMCFEESGSVGLRGVWIGDLNLTEDTYLKVMESIIIEGGRPHREEYSCYLIHRGQEMWGHDRDPSHEPADHGHVGADHKGTHPLWRAHVRRGG